MENKEIIAHKSIDNTQLLTEHLQNTAFLAERFANAFGNGDWAKYAGFFHDLGKANNDWQKYIRGETESTHINHSEAGAQYVYSKGNPKDPASLIIPYLIAGHHAGLPDYHAGSGNSLKSILSEHSYSQLDLQDLQSIISESFPKTLPFGKNDLRIDNPKELSEHFHLWIRMLYSCLVDADFLETEKFMNPQQSDMRTKFSDLQELKQRFDQFMKEKTGHSDKSKINQIRETVLNSCREKARSPQGFFSLNVPTGGGKTLSSMAFALEHAIYHNKKKIIVAIPYTSIIEQTAKVYKYGTDNILNLAGCGKSRHEHRSVHINGSLDDDGADGCDGKLQPHRNAQSQQLPDDKEGKLKVPFPQSQHVKFLNYVNQAQHRRYSLGDHCSIGAALHSHMEDHNKPYIQNYIQHSGDNQKIQRGPAVSQSSQHR